MPTRSAKSGSVKEQTHMPPRLRLLAIGLCFVTFLGLSTEGIAMSFFSRPTLEVVICAEELGKLTVQGEPAAGARVVRWAGWKDEVGEGETFYAAEDAHVLLGADVEV